MNFYDMKYWVFNDCTFEELETLAEDGRDDLLENFPEFLNYNQ